MTDNQLVNLPRLQTIFFVYTAFISLRTLLKDEEKGEAGKYQFIRLDLYVSIFFFVRRAIYYICVLRKCWLYRPQKEEGKRIVVEIIILILDQQHFYFLNNISG